MGPLERGSFIKEALIIMQPRAFVKKRWEYALCHDIGHIWMSSFSQTKWRLS